MELFPPSERCSDNNTSLPVSAVNEPLLVTHSANGGGDRSSRSTDSGSRLVGKDGRANVLTSGVEGCLKRYLVDVMTSIAELPFYYHLTAFIATLFVSWTIFGLLWWLMAAVNGDLLTEDELHLLDERAESMCTQNVYDFASAFLYSVETQTTLGYGSRVSNPACWQSLALLIVQLVVGAAIDGVIAGLVFDKLTRPRWRIKMTWFSRQAVIYRRPDDRSYCLALRVWYRGMSPLLSAAVKAVFIPMSDDSQTTFKDNVPVGINIQLDPGFALFPWPETVIHTIDASSPLWDVSADDLKKSNFELIVTLEGTVESTAVGCQYMTSYKPPEIKWGYTFTQPALEPPTSSSACAGERSTCFRCLKPASGQWMMDCSQFDETIECRTMPRYSAKQAISAGFGNEDTGDEKSSRIAFHRGENRL